MLSRKSITAVEQAFIMAQIEGVDKKKLKFFPDLFLFKD